MKPSHLLLIIALLAAHARCATLRQYSRDWLIAGETSLHKEPKRITAKSVFIAPDFSAVRCAQGYREDAHGNCVKLVRVSQSAQLDFLLQKLNAMYGSVETPGPLPFGGAPVKGPSGQHGPYDAQRPQGNPFGGSPNKEDNFGSGFVDGDKPPKAEPCIELPTTVTSSTATSTVMSTETSTSLTSAETLSVVSSVQVVAATSEVPTTTIETVAVSEGSAEKSPEVVLVDNDGDLPDSMAQVNETAGEVNEEKIPVLDGDDVMGVVENTSDGDLLAVEVNDQAFGDVDVVGHTIETDRGEETSSEEQEVESTTKVLVPESVPVNALEKDIVVDVVEESQTTLTPESTTVVDEVEETYTGDYGEDIIVEPEMGSGEKDDIKESDNVSEDKLFSETANANLDAMLELNNSSQVDKVLPVRNIIPEASSERIQFVDSPIINIQPVRNMFPGGDEIMEIDLKPNDNVKGASLQVHNLNPSKLVPPKFMEAPMKPIPDTPFSLDDYLNRQPVPPIPVYRPYENLNFNPQQQHFPLHYQQPPFPPRNGFVRFPNERDQPYHVDQRVNSVRFPPGEPFNDEKLRQWPNNWRVDNRRVQRPVQPPVMRFWNKMPLIRNTEETNQRYQQDRRRPPPQYYQ